MEQKTKKLEHEDVTKAILGAAFEVHNVLGYGFLEKVYQRSLQAELVKNGHMAELEPSLEVRYKNVVVGNYFADLLVDKKVIVEIKVAKFYRKQDEAQLLNELKASNIRVGLLINFGKDKVEFKRLVF